MIDYERLVELYETFKRLKDYNEENIKIQIVIEVLKAIGYELDEFIFEQPAYAKDKRIDFIIETKNNEKIYVETKRGDKDLSKNDIVYILEYLSRGNIEWGILSNGKRYLLINKYIDNKEHYFEDKVVLDINLAKKYDLNYIKYLGKECLFETNVTKYYRYIAEYKALKFPGDGYNKSWSSYKSTLYNFFDYYANKEKKFRPLEQIRVDDFKDYLEFTEKDKENTNKKLESIHTFKNKYSYVRSMFIELKKSKKITQHHFEEDRNALIDLFDVKPKDEINHLSTKNIQVINDYLINSHKSVRDLIIFLLCIYIGIERATISNFTWDMIDFNKEVIKIGSRELAIPDKLNSLLIQLKEENKTNKIKGNHLFYAYYNKKYNVLKDNSINQIFSKLNKIDEEDEKWADFSPQYIRNNLIKTLFENDYSIEEIAYLTGMDLANMSKIIGYEDICKKVNPKRKKILPKHPFHDLL